MKLAAQTRSQPAPDLGHVLERIADALENLKGDGPSKLTADIRAQQVQAEVNRSLVTGRQIRATYHGVYEGSNGHRPYTTAVLVDATTSPADGITDRVTTVCPVNGGAEPLELARAEVRAQVKHMIEHAAKMGTSREREDVERLVDFGAPGIEGARQLAYYGATIPMLRACVKKPLADLVAAGVLTDVHDVADSERTEIQLPAVKHEAKR